MMDKTNFELTIHEINYLPSLFHAKSTTSSKVSDFDPGVIGLLILCKSQINISDFEAPDANKFV